MNEINGFKQSRISPEHYFRWRRKRALACVEKISNRINLIDKRALDIGCGCGALSYALLEKGTQVWATEIDSDKLKFAQDKLAKNKYFNSVLVKNERLPYDDCFFDIVFIFDVIEHMKNPAKMIQEALRVLKSGGYLYVEFTPYYSITGHHLYDFAKWPIHLLPKEKVKKIVFSKKIKGFMTAEYYWRQFESLNKLRINQFQQMVKKFQKIEERYLIKYPEKFEINIPIINYLGPLKDYFTMSFEGLYQKLK
ncbi:hypothetical protein COW98_04205 [Candidatus Roizmanbacteria bacterium CG22_combo_CG10-13_8_21_14_all_35_9]|uniref:Methyltransferase type 11 domain-containing protein n=4 Tax=Candidatus Roizmaniibacteriota TaxID=1752723 RepID=A0A2M8F3F9_9BACT|nr:MAG: hypothetical protein COX47_03745 [Candidatus Roizmanbacteria bacterium CG23_combo_of_CG06-09_8_20_14_all_35_49]PIP62411.1 MAG: hypothetical protein COW98_04205 [Candidatus Roizmanbacteria bacterium CG22_combo_CG10-13_8_21_14_all_35_9]PIY71379.1 MAG: hypothetical protein COY88_00625 [Candidatus Roizmanbacteria bacterium CG_4_10_14_0_8_um_filter_35_28]PJC33819.1 MAG: hypothetical protein CO048_02290 [Candidatus Roizmanbacteria bacterium CG_4_9_14_0_2_um_filter_35_15]